MVIFLQEDHELPLIEGTARIRGGARDVPDAKVGLIGLYSQAWRTSGTTKRNGDELDDFLEARAAKVESGGGIDSTYLSFSCLKPNFDEVFTAFNELLRSPQFRDDKLDLAKKQAKTSISRRNDDIDSIAARERAKLAYGADSPYARVPEYWTIDAVTRQDLADWYAKTVHPNNIILGISGDFDPARMEALLRKQFESWPRGPEVPRKDVHFTDPKPGIYFISKEDVNQSSVSMVTLGTERDNPDYYALTVMNELFGGGFSSRLFSTIRSQKGLAYSVGGGIGTDFDHPGIFRLGLGTKSASTVDAIQALSDEVQRLIKDPGSAEEVNRAKDNILNSFVFNFDSKDKVLDEEMLYEFYGYPLDFLDKFRGEIEKVTPADVARVVQKYVAPAKFATLVVGNAKEFGKPLSSLGPVKTIDISIPETPRGAAGQGPATAPLTSNVAGKQLIAKVVGYLGGAAKVDGIKAIEWTGTQLRHAPQGDLSLGVVQTVVFPDRMHLSMQTPMGPMVIVTTGASAFMQRGDQANDAPAEMHAEMLRELRRDLVAVAQHANDPAFAFAASGTAKVANKEAAVLNISDRGSNTSWLVDPSTGEVLQAKYQTSGQEGPVERAVDFSDYREVDGIKLPFKRTTSENGEVVVDTSFSAVKVNPQIDPKIFEKPAAK